MKQDTLEKTNTTVELPQSFDFCQKSIYFSYAALILINIAAAFCVPVPIQLFINSCTCVYIGSLAGIQLQQKWKFIQKQKGNKIIKRHHDNTTKDVTDEDEEEEQAEKMTAKDAYMFPVYGSLVLFSLYLAFKFFDKSVLSMILRFYFSVLGQLCLMSIFENNISHFSFAKDLDKKVIFKKQYIIPKLMSQPSTFLVNQMNLLSFIVSLIPTSIYIFTNNWIMNNVFGIAFSISGIKAISLPNFKIGFILLWGLFFYDIFWVYGTDVMVSVAKAVDAPIKLLFPKDFSVTPPKFSMLGLGDIVIPGIFVGLSLKYDIETQLHKVGDKFSKIKTPYFYACFAGYCLGILVTFLVMVIFDHPQPALLFLVPGCTLSVLLLALIKNQVKDLFLYEEFDMSPKKDSDQKEGTTSITKDGSAEKKKKKRE